MTPRYDTKKQESRMKSGIKAATASFHSPARSRARSQGCSWHKGAAALLLSTLLAACAMAPAGLSDADITRLRASPDRSAADRTNDVRRKPQQMLAFAGVAPGMRVLDLGAGGGYSTELMARAVGPQGRV